MELLKPTVHLARIKKAKILEKKLFIKVLSALDVKITFPIHGTADSDRKKCQDRHFGENRTPSHCRFVEALFYASLDDVTGLEDRQPRVGFNRRSACACDP